MSSPGKKVYSFAIWIMLIPLTAFVLLIAFVTALAAIGS